VRIAIVGSGISGLVCAYLLSREHDVVVYEANDYVGGHTHTVRVDSDGETVNVDTGFIVFNPENYPNFTRLLKQLKVESEPSTMSFSVRDEESGLEYNGTSLNTLFAQRRNLLSPRFLRMIKDILRFYREARELIEGPETDLPLGEYLEQNRYSREFRDWHLYPMAAAVWSTGLHGVESFPAKFLVRFFNNHGFLQASNRPQWRVLKGGSASYIGPLTRPFDDSIRLQTPVKAIRRLPNAVSLTSGNGDTEQFDQVVIAAHSDQALKMLADPSDEERDILGSIPYTSNDTVLHTDANLLPRRPLARASWNYHLPMRADNRPSVTYYMNSLQNLTSREHYCVTLNRREQIAPQRIIKRLTYEHPAFSVRAISAQGRKHEISGRNRTFYCGAYWGYGFHEDGVVSALDVCANFGARLRS
jgi:predicted NAD/FAD-binding protein